MHNDVNANRKHKDRLFRFIFHKEEHLLSLYNAVCDRDYTDPKELEIYTMEDFVYMGMKNDLSFLIDWNMNVFEHQSTYNPNMPLRGFMYMSAMFGKFIALNQLDIYRSKAIQLPLPRYYVFYNGTKKMDDEEILLLTDNMPYENAKEVSCAEFRAHVININDGHNPKMMERCPLLKEYALFISDIRKNMELGLDLKTAIDRAVEKCIERDGKLAEIMRGHRAEVTNMLLDEYNEALHIASEKELSREEGRALGREEERINTEREKQRAEDAEQRADNAEKKAEKLLLEKEIFRMKIQRKTEEEIAEAMGISLDDVNRILSDI